MYVTWTGQMVPQFQEKQLEHIVTFLKKMIMSCFDWRSYEISQKLRPDVQLYELDGSLQSDLGVYLTAYVFVGSLSEGIPVKLRNNYHITDINEKQVNLFRGNTLSVVFCQKVASGLITIEE